MASPQRERDSGFDKILKNTEFENDQQIRAIKAESEKIQVYETQLKEKLTQIAELEKSIGDIDEHTKQSQKQFSINNDNCKSLKCTASVLADHEEALKAKLEAITKEVETERNQQNATLDKYGSVWVNYKRKYDSFEKAHRLQSERTELQTLLETNTAIEMQLDEVKKRLYTFEHKNDDKLSLVSVVLKIAQLHVETQNNKRARTESKQVLQMQQDIDTLQSKVEKLVQQDKQRQSDNNEYFEKEITPHSNNIVEAMEVENCMVEEQPVNTGENLQKVNKTKASQICIPSATNTPLNPTTPQKSSVSNIPGLGNPCSLFTPTPSAPQTKQIPLRYQFEMPKLCTPPHMSGAAPVSHAIHSSITLMASSIVLPPTLAISIPSNTAPGSTLPSLSMNAVSVTPRPSFPVLHTPIQSRDHMSCSPRQTNIVPSVTLSSIRPAQHIPLKQSKTVTLPSSLSIAQLQQSSSQSQPISVAQTNNHGRSLLLDNPFDCPSQPSKVTGQFPPLGSSSSGQLQLPSSLGQPLPPAGPSSLGQPQASVVPSSLGQLQPSVVPSSLGQPQASVVPSSLGQPQPSVVPSSLGRPQPPAAPSSLGQPQPPVVPSSLGRPQPPAGPSSLGQPQPSAVPSSLGRPQPPAGPSSLGQPQPSAVPSSLGRPQPSAGPSSLGQPQPSAVPSSLGRPQDYPLSTTTSTLDDTMTTYNVERSIIVQDGSHASIEQTRAISGNFIKPLVSEHDNYCVNTPLTHGEAGPSGVEDSLRKDSEVTTNSHLYNTDQGVQYSSAIEQASNYQESDQFYNSQDQQPMFTGNDESRMYYKLDGQVASHGDEPTAVSAGGGETGSVFMEGFRFDQESVNSYHNDSHGQFNLFGSDQDHMELPGGANSGRSDFSFNFVENNQPSNTGSFFF